MPRKRLTTQGNAPTKAPSKKARQRSPAKVAQASQQPTQAPPQHDPQSTLQAQPLQVPQSALQAQQVPQVPQLLQAPQPELQAQPVLQAPHLLQATQPMLQTKPVPQPTVQQTSKKIGEEGACSGEEFPPFGVFKRKDDDIMPGLTEHLEKMRAGDGGISNLFLYKDDERLPVLTENIKESGAVSSSPDGKSVPYLIKNPYSDILMRGKKLNEAGAFSEEEFDSKGIRPSGKSHSEYENFEDIFLDPFFTTMKEESLRDNDLPKFSKGAESREKIKESDLDIPKEDLLHHMRTEVTTVRHARGLVVGCAGAGKTTLLYSLMGISLDEIKEIKSTRGLQVYEHIFTVADGSLLATENLERKFLVRVPISLLTKKNDYLSQDANQIEKDNTVDRSKLDIKCDVPMENTKPKGQDKNSTDLTSDIKGKDQSTTASNTIAKDTVAETLSQEVIKKILDAQENEISVSMIDFAGQFAYYACHQIYMRSSAFYILVMDMTKNFEEDVIGEEEEQKGSVFTTWKYKDYVEFWLNSIKSFGGPEAPVLIVATHTEDRTDDDIDEYFACLWRSLSEVDKTWLSKHRSEENEFACELINIDEDERTQKLQSLKKSLVEVVSNKLDTKIPVRSSWALLEHLLRESGKPIISYEEIQEMNRKVPEQYRLESEEEITNFLTFFHDHGILLYFHGEATRTHAILGLQWFSNAFSRLIADKKHINKDCKRRHIKEWELFNKTGELKSTLVDALWKDEKVDGEDKQSYKEYKTELMSYMERLRMLVSIGDTDKTPSWYVPCMNKKPFTKDIIKAKACSSILCFRFTSFAIFVFYRLVAYCMSSLNWKVVPDKRDICLFQTAAVFEFKNQTVLLGIFDKDIQLQVVSHSLDIKTDVSCEVGNLIHKALDELTETFENTYLSFQRGYKCQMIFCDQTDTSFTPEEELCQLKNEEIQCPCCPMGEKHLIKVNQTRRFWEQEKMGEDRERNLYCLDDPLNRPPTDKELNIVSRYIGADFLLLGIELGLEDTKIQQIRMDYQNYGVITQIFQMLCAWKEKEGKQASVDKFLEAIEAHKGEIDIEKIKSAFNL